MDTYVELATPQVMRLTRVRAGRPNPRGATWTGLGVNFALFSAHASKVELCLFDERGERELERIELPEFTDEVWHGFLPDARPGTIYAYRALTLRRSWATSTGTRRCSATSSRPATI
jgi:isoamylase